MRDLEQLPQSPPPGIRFKRTISLRGSLREVWRARELVRALAERDLRARYKQTSLGFAWALVPPVGMLVVFTVFVQRVGDVYTEGVPYELYAYVGLITWGFFSGALGGAGQSLLANISLMNKVYCPREVFPLAGIVTVTVDTLVTSLVLIALFPLNGFAPKLETVWFPVIFAVQLAVTIGAVLLLSVAVVYLRDLRHAIGLIIQIGLLATPVAYSLDAIQAEWRPVYCFVNPIAGVIDSYRQTMLLGNAPTWSVLGPAAAGGLLLFVVGLWAFKRLETGLADVA